MKRFTKGLVFSLIVAAGWVSVVDATQVLQRTPRQLGEQSELVVRGKVVDVRSHWNDKRTKIYTTTRVAVDESYKGTESGTVELVQMGGVVDKVKVTVHGSLEWRAGEEVLLFLESPDGRSYQVSGFSQGKFNIERNTLTGEAFVNRPELVGTELVEAASLEPTAASSRVDDMPLSQFINQALGRR